MLLLGRGRMMANDTKQVNFYEIGTMKEQG